MSRIVLVLFAVLTVASAIPDGYDDEQCGPNEEYKYCGSVCGPTCAACSQCVPGCVYNNGYVTCGAGLSTSFLNIVNTTNVAWYMFLLFFLLK